MEEFLRITKNDYEIRIKNDIDGEVWDDLLHKHRDFLIEKLMLEIDKVWQGYIFKNYKASGKMPMKKILKQMDHH